MSSKKQYLINALSIQAGAAERNVVQAGDEVSQVSLRVLPRPRLLGPVQIPVHPHAVLFSIQREPTEHLQRFSLTCTSKYTHVYMLLFIS